MRDANQTIIKFDHDRNFKNDDFSIKKQQTCF